MATKKEKRLAGEARALKRQEAEDAHRAEVLKRVQHQREVREAEERAESRRTAANRRAIGRMAPPQGPTVGEFLESARKSREADGFGF